MKRTIKRLAIITALLALIACVCLLFAQPLVSSRAYTVTAILDGAPIRAELLRPPFIPGTYYLHLPDAPLQRYSWFGITFSRQWVFSPIALYTGWHSFAYIHTDQANGVLLTDGKMEDHWSVTFTPYGVQFSNALLSVSLSKSK